MEGMAVGAIHGWLNIAEAAVISEKRRESIDRAGMCIPAQA